MIKFLSVIIVITFLLSVFNWYEEGDYQGFIFANVGAVFGASLATTAYYIICKINWLPHLPFAIAASVTTGITSIAYLYYALNGQAENSAASAAHMHVILVPILLTAIGVFLLVIAFLVAWVYKLLNGKNV